MSTQVMGSGRQVLEVEGKVRDYWDIGFMSACPQRICCVGCGMYVTNDSERRPALEETDRIREILSRLLRKDESDEDE